MRKVKTSSADGFWKIKFNVRFRGTRRYWKYFDDFMGKKLGRITELFESKRFTQEEILKWQQLEDEMIQQGKYPLVFMKVEVLLVVDMKTRLIKKFISNARLSSFRASDEEL